MTYAWLPELLGEIAEAAGLDAALKLADEVGGTRVDIPARVGPRHWLSRCVGPEAAKKICDHFRTLDPSGRERGMRHVIIPRGPATNAAKTRQKIAAALDKGVSPRKAARTVGASERTAWRLKAKRRSPADDPQGNLL